MMVHSMVCKSYRAHALKWRAPPASIFAVIYKNHPNICPISLTLAGLRVAFVSLEWQTLYVWIPITEVREGGIACVQDYSLSKHSFLRKL